ncbi:hypothetical protein Geob_0998 [Geotalea daltonii FRC-32]|uniref:SEC-C motif-containing protein n=1 Tax=Geotalea daltonii (strain DSM 22248 / JCM 15807 / FRC-32) TaxID=316067 RepID=B9M2I1_GEODF|nr:DUF5677 domain-containing protein [Geotalea daltonii]ACM19360.1 hypothetical protein Geob_0998 [Geotalea daltonii FRC-32]
MKKIGRNEPCPCGSGKKFKKCCDSKDFRLRVDESGDLLREYSIDDDELLSALRGQVEVFREIFGREPLDDDPLFLEKYLITPEEVKNNMIAAMEKSGISADLIYAYKKTGYLISSSNLDKFPGRALIEWDDAQKEFQKHGGDPYESSKGFVIKQLVGEVQREITSLIYLFGFIGDRYINTLGPDQSNDYFILTHVDYICFCLTKSHRTLLSIKTLLDNRMSDDAYSLTRSLYENYLHIIYVLKHPSQVHDLVDAVIGLHAGTHEYEKKGKGYNKKVIVDKKTGQKYMGQISGFTMAESSFVQSDVNFFDVFYQKSSQVLHPNIMAFEGLIGDKGLNALQTRRHDEAVFYSVMVGGMVVQAARSLPDVNQILKADINTVLGRVRLKLITMLECLAEDSKDLLYPKYEIDVLLQRLNDMEAIDNKA